MLQVGMKFLASPPTSCGDVHWPMKLSICVHKYMKKVPNFAPCHTTGLGKTYKWKSTVFARVDLRLVEVDVHSWMSQRSSTTVANSYSLLQEADWLLMDQVNCSLWRGLYVAQSAHTHDSPEDSSNIFLRNLSTKIISPAIP